MAVSSLPDSAEVEHEDSVSKGGVACPFPWRLHKCLADCEKNGYSDIVSWLPHGRAFAVHKPKAFVQQIMPRYFGQTKYPSFQRQLNLYGFSRFAHGKDKGSYYHLCFVRGHTQLVHQMVRRKIKGNKVRHTIEPSSEPDFYHPAWENHFEASYPPKLFGMQCAAVVKALCEKAMNKTRPGYSNSLPPVVPSTVFQPDISIATTPPQLLITVPPKPSEQVMILPRLTAERSNVTPELAPQSSYGAENVAGSTYSMDESLKDGDLITFEGIPFHYLDNHDENVDILSDAGPATTTEEDNFSICSARRCISSNFLGNADFSFQFEHDSFLNNLTAF